MKEKTKLTRLWSLLLALVMVVGMFPVTSLAADAYKDCFVYVFNKDIDKQCGFYYDPSGKNPDKLYYTNGGTDTGTLEENPNWNARFDPDTETLYLRNYDDGRIAIASSSNIPDYATIILSGDNKITNNTENTALSSARTKLTITAEEKDNGTLTITNTNYYTGIHAINLTIGGYADVTVDMPISPDYNRQYLYGIYTKQTFKLEDHASCYVYITKQSVETSIAYGIFANEIYTINTSGNMNVDVSQVDLYSVGIFSAYPNNTITRVGSMFIKYKKGSYRRGEAINPNTVLDDMAADHAININDDKDIVTCRYGTPYTVTVTNGTCNAVDTSTGQYLAGDTVTLSPNVLQDGSSFLKWTSEDVDLGIGQIQSLTFTMPDKDVAVRAVYAHTVTFNANGHGTAPAAQRVEVGNTANKPTAPKADGWTFCGWYKDAECTEYFDFSTAITNNITLYAAWTQGNTYTVTFNANGHGTAPDPQIVKEGGKATRPATDPTAERWIFGGWMKDPNGYNGYFDFDTETITKDITLYADWAEPYYVYFEANGGTGTMEPVAVYPGYDCTLPKCGFTAPEGKKFKGWAFDANSTEVVQFTSFEVSGGNKTLYAIWEYAPLTGTENTTVDFENLIIYTEVENSSNIADIIVLSDSAAAVTTASYIYGSVELYGTGTIITVTDGGKKLGDFTLIVIGDVNGDSVCDVIDAAQVASVSSAFNTLSGAYQLAADFNSDGLIDATDYQAIVNRSIA